MRPKEIESGLILRGVVAKEIGMGVAVEPPSFVCGLDHFMPLTYTDGSSYFTIYGLRDFCRLAIRGNGAALALLRLPTYEVQTGLGSDLVALREAFASKDMDRVNDFLILAHMGHWRKVHDGK